MSSSGRTAVEAGVRSSNVPLGWVLALDLGMALLLGAGWGFLQANAGDLAIPAPPVAVALAGAGVMGVLLGLVARLILQNWMGTLKLLLSLLSLLAWMAVAAVTCAAWTGLDPFEYLARADHWVKIGQLTIGCLSILAANLVGRRVWEAAPWQWVYRLRSQSPPPLTKISLKWGLGLTLAAAVVLGAGLGFLQTIADQFSVPPLAVALAGAAVMGLLTGLMTRFALRGWSEGLRIAVTLVALLIWMVEAEITYAATVGLSPLAYLAGADNWVEMGQLVIGCLGAIVGGVGRRRANLVRAGAVEVGSAPQRVQRPAGRPRQKARVRTRRALSLPKLRLPALTLRRPRPVKNGSQVKVIAKEEDRCPYCLDVIEKKDSRGVVVCEICGAPHHADCWEAGGKCQVPHLIV